MLIKPKKLPASEKADVVVSALLACFDSFCAFGKVVGTYTVSSFDIQYQRLVTVREGRTNKTNYRSDHNLQYSINSWTMDGIPATHCKVLNGSSSQIIWDTGFEPDVFRGLLAPHCVRDRCFGWRRIRSTLDSVTWGGEEDDDEDEYDDGEEELQHDIA